MSPRFRKLPVIVEARRFDGRILGEQGAYEVARWVGDGATIEYSAGPMPAALLRIDTLHGSVEAHGGDWIIKGEAGDFWPCRGDIFEASYELILPGDQSSTDIDNLAAPLSDDA